MQPAPTQLLLGLCPGLTGDRRQSSGCVSLMPVRARDRTAFVSPALLIRAGHSGLPRVLRARNGRRTENREHTAAAPYHLASDSSVTPCCPSQKPCKMGSAPPAELPGPGALEGHSRPQPTRPTPPPLPLGTAVVSLTISRRAQGPLWPAKKATQLVNGTDPATKRVVCSRAHPQERARSSASTELRKQAALRVHPGGEGRNLRRGKSQGPWNCIIK